MNGSQHNATRALVCFVGAVILAGLMIMTLAKSEAVLLGCLAVVMLLLAAAFGFSALVEKEAR